MSAYQVSPNHIATILNTYARYTSAALTADQRDEIAEILAEENATSVNYRYSEKDEAVSVTAEAFDEGEAVSPGAATKLVQCLEYQSCEHPEWEQSEAHGFCAQFKAAFAAFPPARSSDPWSI